MLKPLIVSASPRDIPEVKEALREIDADKVIAKYFREYDAYHILRNFFLEHKEYTHMVVCPDDLVVTVYAFERLRRDLQEHDYQVLAGVCNNNYLCQDQFACSYKVNVFEGVKVEDADKWVDRPIIQIEREGFACNWMRRDVVEKIDLRGVNWADNEAKKGHAAFDYQFSMDCIKLGIPIYVDTSARMLHLGCRKGVGVMENWGLGKYKPRLEWFKGKTMTSWDNV